MEALISLMPGDAASVIVREIRRLQEQPPAGLVSIGLPATLWLSSSMFMAIIDAMNRIRSVRDSRSYIKLRLLAMLMTLSQASILIVALATTLAWPQILGWLGLSWMAAVLATFVHAITVFVIILLSFAMTLYFAPDGDQRWEWITPGSLLGTLVLIGVNLLFRAYVQQWGNYSATYGSLAGIVVLMSWVWLSSTALLVAAELNKVIEDASPLGNR